MTVYAITDTKKGRTGIAPTYLHTTPNSCLSCFKHHTEAPRVAPTCLGKVADVSEKSA